MVIWEVIAWAYKHRQTLGWGWRTDGWGNKTGIWEANPDWRCCAPPVMYITPVWIALTLDCWHSCSACWSRCHQQVSPTTLVSDVMRFRHRRLHASVVCPCHHTVHRFAWECCWWFLECLWCHVFRLTSPVIILRQHCSAVKFCSAV